MATASLPTLPPFLPTPGAPAQPWLSWKTSFFNYLVAIEADESSPKRKRALLWALLGLEGQRIVSTFPSTVPASSAAVSEFDELVAALDEHFAAKANVVVERKQFLNRVQSPGESVLDYLSALRQLGYFCDFGESLENRIAEVFLAGLNSSEVQDRVIRESAEAGLPSLERIVLLAQQFEQASRDCDRYRQFPSSLSRSGTPHAVQVVQGVFIQREQDGRRSNSNLNIQDQNGERRHAISCSPANVSFSPQHQSRESRAHTRTFVSRVPRDAPPGARALRHGAELCHFCGRRPHPREECPASGMSCFSCGKLGHFSNVCRSSPPSSAASDRRQLAFPPRRGRAAGRRYQRLGVGRNQTTSHESVAFSDEEEQQPKICTVGSPEVLPNGRADSRPRNFTADVQVNGSTLPLLIDTGSEVSILSESMFNKINSQQQIRLRKPPRTLVHYLRGSIPVVGCFQTKVGFKERSAELLFYVVRNGRSLLGTDALPFRFLRPLLPVLSRRTLLPPMLLRHPVLAM
ncbi:uncharacterized protein ISCGN_024584 [Ixodes scapularis]